MPAATLYDTEVAPTLAGHVGSEFERVCRQWTRASRQVSRVAAWWGPALHALRRDGSRGTEEINIVATAHGKVTEIGEARWRRKSIDVDYLAEIDAYKIPALRQSEIGVVAQPEIVLFSRSGYTDRLRDKAETRSDLTLIDISEALVGG
jgi:hypothetical protein